MIHQAFSHSDIQERSGMMIIVAGGVFRVHGEWIPFSAQGHKRTHFEEIPIEMQ